MEPFRDVNETFKIWVGGQRLPGGLGSRGAVIKNGPRVLKTATRSDFGDADTGEIRRQELRLRTYERRADGPGYNFDDPDPKTTWSCENDEINRLLAFLSDDQAEPGRYCLVDMTSPTGDLVRMVQDGRVDTSRILAELSAAQPTTVADSLVQTSEGLSAAQTAVLRKRLEKIHNLQQVVTQPDTTETDIQRLIGEEYWVFGGRYVGVADRRNLIPMDQHDIPLLQADGTLHVVELKGPCIRRIVKKYRNHYIVGDEVNDAVGQAMNYLRDIDDLGSSLSTYYRNELGSNYNLSRVFATVVIGHPRHSELDDSVIDRAIRSYNSHLSRVQVVTYKELLDAAERALTFEDSPRVQL